MGTTTQAIIGSLNGKNPTGSAIVGAGFAVVSNALFSTFSPALTISLTGATNLYFSFATFREISKKVSEAQRKAVGLNFPQPIFGCVNCYRYGVPLLLIGGIGTAAMAGYGAATIAAYQIASTGTSALMSCGWVTPINWISSAFIPAGTVITNLWWGHKAPGEVEKILKKEPCFIADISVHFSELEKLEKLGLGKQFKDFFEKCQSIAPRSVDIVKVKAEVIETIKQTAEKAKQNWLKTEEEINKHNKTLTELEDRRKQLLEIIGEWGTQLTTTLDNLKNKKQELEKRGEVLAQEAKKINGRFPLEYDDENKLNLEIHNILKEIMKKDEQLPKETNDREKQKLEQELLDLENRKTLLEIIKTQFKIKKEIKFIEEQVSKALQSKNIDICKYGDLGKFQENWPVVIQKAKHEKEKTGNNINMLKQQVSKLQEESIKWQAISQRVRRSLEAVKNQFSSGDPLQMHENIKQIIEDILECAQHTLDVSSTNKILEDYFSTATGVVVPIIFSYLQENNKSFNQKYSSYFAHVPNAPANQRDLNLISFVQVFNDVLTSVGDLPAQDEKRGRNEKGEPISPPVLPFMSLLDERSNQAQGDKVSISVLPSPSTSQGKVINTLKNQS